MGLAEELKERFSEDEPADESVVVVRFPRAGAPSVELDDNFHLISVARLELLEMIIYQEIQKKRAAMLRAARSGEVSDVCEE